MWRLRRRDPRSDEAEQALRDARAAALNISDRHAEVLEVASSLRKIRRDNHFSEHLTRIMKEGHE